MILWLPFSILVGNHTAESRLQASTGIELRLRRNFGFGLGGQIQGRFSISASGPEDLERVVFYVDEQQIGEDRSAPFTISFSTGDFDTGLHTIRATGFTAGGEELTSNEITRQFVSVQSVVLIVLFVLGLVLVFRIAPRFLKRNRSLDTGASYGYLGGTICPNCQKPFGIHWWSLRLGFARYDRCPHCGKWNMIQRASNEALKSAREPVEKEKPGASSEGDGKIENSYQRMLDESRYREE